MNAAAYILDNGLTTDKVALITSRSELTYTELEKAVLSVTRYLHSVDISRGDCILIVADSSNFWASAYLGTIMAGAVAVPIPGTTKAENLRKIISQIEPSMAFVQNKYLKSVGDLLNDECKIVSDFTSGASFRDVTEFEALLLEVDGAASLRDACQVNEFVDLASIMFTSGSTGEPRGVMISHRNIIANTDSILRYMELREDDCVMAVLPFHYCYGLSLLHTHLKVGGSVVIETSFMFPEAILNRMEETRCSGLAGVPSTFQILLRNSSLKKRPLSSLKYIQQAGGKLSNALIMELSETLPDKQIYVMYGQTEATARLSYLPPSLLEEKLGSIGKGIPGVTLNVVDEKGLQVSPGKVGEIIAKGDNIALGYWMDVEETQVPFMGGKLRTGDLATVDDDGFIYVVDRAADFLKCGGYRISSKEVEEVAMEFPEMVEAAVVQQPDATLGEAVRLYVVHKKGSSITKDLKNHCTANLGWSFTPKKIIYLDSLPKTGAGKVDKQKLKPEVFDADPDS